MDKSISIIISGSLVIALGVLLFGGDTSPSSGTSAVQNVEIRDGVQYVTIKTRGGYKPRVSEIQAGIPTKLIMETGGTYDCSADLSIPAISYRKLLNPTGEEIIDAGTFVSGQTLTGGCGMGMYNFSVRAK